MPGPKWKHIVFSKWKLLTLLPCSLWSIFFWLSFQPKEFLLALELPYQSLCTRPCWCLHPNENICLINRLKPGTGPYKDLGDNTNCRLAFNSTVFCRISSAEVNINGNACRPLSICSWRKEGDLSLDLCYFSRMLPVQANRYKMKKWQTDGERNTTNSAGDCVQGQPAPMFSKLWTFCWKLSPWSFVHKISVCVSSYIRGGHFDATFPIFLQCYISGYGTGLSVSSWDL